MDLNKINLTSSKVGNPIDRKKLEESGENIYAVINILAQRASQINSFLKSELDKKLNDFLIPKEVSEENVEDEKRTEIVSFFEQLPKPTTLAIEEFLEGKLNYRKSED